MIIIISNLMTNDYQCLICFEKCKYPAILDLNCECQYNVHYKCYNRWWKMKKTCIICHELSGNPKSYYIFKDKDNYRFLLDLNNQSNTKNQVLIPNKEQNMCILISIFVCMYFINLYFFIILLFCLVFCFFWLLP